MQTFAPQARVSANLSHALRASDVTQRRCHQGGVAFERSLKVGCYVGVRLEVLGGIPRGSGIHTGVREEDAARSCLLVIIGVPAEGNKELVSIGDGLRESTASWLEVLRDLKARGLERGPLLAVGDGALGFWAALDQIYPQTRPQRCWVHKTANVLNALPKSARPQRKNAAGLTVTLF